MLDQPTTILTHPASSVPVIGGAGGMVVDEIPANAITYNGAVLTYNGAILTYTAP